MRVLALLLALLPSVTAAQDLPCGPATERLYSFRWRPGAGQVTSYRLHRGASPGVYTETFEMHDLIADAEKIVGVDGVFANDRAWYVALSAVGPGGESSLSNEIQIPAAVLPASDPRCQAPAPPSEFELLEERVQALERRLDAIHEGSAP